jgi:lipopolysaccharide/colanic/teichoic acid biosynthesis glycosyltransferase
LLPLRRSIEAAIAAAALVALSPLLALIALAIRISSPGPVFYMAERAGLHGARFRMYKFRTMYVAAAGSRIAAPGDPRIIPLGRLLRRLRLDELPQLINIIRGEMAFVGPRPEDPWIVEHHYTDGDRETLNVLPGLTSPGTLYYCTHVEPHLERDGTEATYIAGPLRRKLDLDCAWIRERSAYVDLRLAIGTLFVVAKLLKKSGAHNGPTTSAGVSCAAPSRSRFGNPF